MTNSRLDDYLDVVGKKIDLHVDAFLQRVVARRRGDLERVDYLNEVILKPLDSQIAFLTRKLEQLAEQTYGK